MRKTGVFGGTFNPPHKGHLKLAEQFFDMLALDRMLVIPACIPPHKQAPELASGGDRMALCRELFCGDQFEISDLELVRGGRSYTSDTLRILKDLYPEDELYLIMGSDMLVTLHAWHEPEEILRRCRICAATRGDLHQAQLTAYVKKHFPDLEDRFIIRGIEPVVISSTQLRSRIAAGSDVHEYLTDGEIAYIAEKGLYHAGHTAQ